MSQIRRFHGVNVFIAATYIALFLMTAGCTTPLVKKMYTETQRPREQVAIIKSIDYQTCPVCLTLGTFVISVDNVPVVNKWQEIQEVYPKEVHIAPGEHKIEIMKREHQSRAIGFVSLSAMPGKTYIVKSELKGYAVIFYFEDAET